MKSGRAVHEGAKRDQTERLFDARLCFSCLWLAAYYYGNEGSSVPLRTVESFQLQSLGLDVQSPADFILEGVNIGLEDIALRPTLHSLFLNLRVAG